MALFDSLFLQDLSVQFEGAIPQPMDMSETDQDRLLYQALCSSDYDEALEYIKENGTLAKMMKMAGDDAVEEVKNSLYAALEDSMIQEIDDWNASREEDHE